MFTDLQIIIRLIFIRLYLTLIIVRHNPNCKTTFPAAMLRSEEARVAVLLIVIVSLKLFGKLKFHNHECFEGNFFLY